MVMVGNPYLYVAFSRPHHGDAARPRPSTSSRAALLKRISQNRGHLAIQNVKAVGNGTVLTAKLQEFVPYQPLDRRFDDDRHHVAYEGGGENPGHDWSKVGKYVPNKHTHNCTCNPD